MHDIWRMFLDHTDFAHNYPSLVPLRFTFAALREMPGSLDIGYKICPIAFRPVAWLEKLYEKGIEDLEGNENPHIESEADDRDNTAKLESLSLGAQT
jgi:hypothetical protein